MFQNTRKLQPNLNKLLCQLTCWIPTTHKFESLVQLLIKKEPLYLKQNKKNKEKTSTSIPYKYPSTFHCKTIQIELSIAH